MSILRNLLQEKDIADLREQATLAQARYATLNDLAELEDALGRVMLINQTLCEILRERVGVTEEELLRKMREIDLRDGVADGKISDKPYRRKKNPTCSCKRCGVSQSSRHSRCIYCGHAL